MSLQAPFAFVCDISKIAKSTLALAGDYYTAGLASSAKFCRLSGIPFAYDLLPIARKWPGIWVTTWRKTLTMMSDRSRHDALARYDERCGKCREKNEGSAISLESPAWIFVALRPRSFLWRCQDRREGTRGEGNVQRELKTWLKILRRGRKWISDTRNATLFGTITRESPSKPPISIQPRLEIYLLDQKVLTCDLAPARARCTGWHVNRERGGIPRNFLIFPRIIFPRY